MRQRPKTGTITLALSAIVVALSVYGVWVEPQLLRVDSVLIKADLSRYGFEAGLRVVQVSDIHFSDGESEMLGSIIGRVNSLEPEVVVLTGDMVDGSGSDIHELSRLLGNLNAPVGVFAVLGNHEYSQDISGFRAELEEAGVILLVNEAHQIGENDEGLYLVGIDDLLEGTPDLERALAGISPDAQIIMLWHEPDTFDTYSDKRVFLQLSGHSHGGQIGVPILSRFFLPPGAGKFPDGLYQLGTRTLYTSTGVGTTTIPARIGVVPAITVLQIE